MDPGVLPDPSLLPPELAVAISMVSVELFLLTRIVPGVGPAPTRARMVLAGSALLGSAAFLLALLWSYLHPDLNSLTLLFEASGIGMGFPPGLWMIAVIAFRDRRIERSSWSWPVLLTGLTLAGELLMGLTLAVAQGQHHDPLGWAAATLTSPWYLLSMAAAMVLLAQRVPLPRTGRIGLTGLAGTGALGALWPVDPVLGSVSIGVGMAISLLALGRELLMDPPRSPASARWTRGIALGFLAMSVGGFAGAIGEGPGGGSLLFGGAMAAVMGTELLALLRAGFVEGGIDGRVRPDPGDRAVPAPG